MTDKEFEQKSKAIRDGLEFIFDTYGTEHQLTKLAEECAELIQAIARFKNARCTVTYNAVLEEFCDVCNVGDQLMMFKSSGFDGIDYRAQKVLREIKRIQNRNTATLASLINKAKEA